MGFWTDIANERLLRIIQDTETCLYGGASIMPPVTKEEAEQARVEGERRYEEWKATIGPMDVSRLQELATEPPAKPETWRDRPPLL